MSLRIIYSGAMQPAPVATRYTYDFVRRHLPQGARDILEIGCGDGELAARLLDDGLRVVALDSDEACVASARAAGVDAKVAAWPTPVEQAFEAVLFTRSLHHITPLDEAIDAAVGALRSGGRIIVEDFRVELQSPRTDQWFVGLARLFDTAGLFADPGTLDVLIEKLDFGEHRHELHSSVAVAESLRRHGPVHDEDAAYYFRYVEAAIAEPLTAALFNYELAMIEAGAIDALGKRFVVTPQP